jgi:PHP family Zn ribbon phosphoesterase
MKPIMVDHYRTAKCPKCGRFMKKTVKSWACVNPVCRK